MLALTIASLAWSLNSTEVPYYGAGVSDAPPLSLSEAAQTGEPLFRVIFGADPTARIFNGEFWLYVSHDPTETHTTQLYDGETTEMSITEFHMFSASSPDSGLVHRGVALKLEDVKWATKVVWAPDVAQKPDGTIHIYFPALDREGNFRIGVASADKPEGPFTAHPHAIEGSYSIDPYVFTEPSGTASLFFGGLWGGQLEKWKAPNHVKFTEGKALGPQLARLKPDWGGFEGEPVEVSILDEFGQPLQASDTARRFFEASWVFERGGSHYMIYSTGDTHNLVYATAANHTGPYMFRGRLLPPVVGWTTHAALVHWHDEWWLVYQDSTLSGGETARRNLKVVKVVFAEDGSMKAEFHSDDEQASRTEMNVGNGGGNMGSSLLPSDHSMAFTS